jgi:hypothetical protein
LDSVPLASFAHYSLSGLLESRIHVSKRMSVCAS